MTPATLIIILGAFVTGFGLGYGAAMREAKGWIQEIRATLKGGAV